MRSAKNLPIIIAAILIVVAGVIFFMAIIGVQQLVPVMVPKSDTGAYAILRPSDLTTVDVPKKAVEDQPGILTEDEYNKQYNQQGNKKTLITTARLFKDEPISQNRIAATASQSYAAVLPDERVVSVTTTMPGSVLGTIQPGDVVDVSGSGSSDSTSTSDAKVLCISSKSDGCASVLPPSVEVTASAESSSASSSQNGAQSVYLILAVPTADAGSLAGGSVVLSLNTYCAFDASGKFIDARENQPCDLENSDSAGLGETATGATPDTTGGGGTPRP